MKGKVKELFEEWYAINSQVKEYQEVNMSDFMKGFIIDTFNGFSKAMQWGVMQDFYDSQGIKIDVFHSASFDDTKFPDLDYVVAYYIDDNNQGGYRTRQEARDAALIKAEEILNGKP